MTLSLIHICWKALAAQVIPYVMLGVGVLTFCTLNYTHYGVFALSDFSEGSFAAAMGAMMRVDTDSTAPYLSCLLYTSRCV